MRVLSEMISPLAAMATAEPERHVNVWSMHDRACKIARQLPLVHRTCKSGDEASWLELMKIRRFAADEPCTARESAAGIPRAAYFFLGCGAYPDGLIGFVLKLEAVIARPSSYTPLDSGSLEKHAKPTNPAVVWDGPAKNQFLGNHLGRGEEVARFAGPYLAAHFRDPLHYVKRGQLSQPDFPSYHGLADPHGDRRAYTIEVQAHDDVPFDDPIDPLIEIVVARPALVEDLPDDLIGKVRVAAAENEVLEAIADGIIGRIKA